MKLLLDSRAKTHLSSRVNLFRLEATGTPPVQELHFFRRERCVGPRPGSCAQLKLIGLSLIAVVLVSFSRSRCPVTRRHRSARSRILRGPSWRPDSGSIRQSLFDSLKIKGSKASHQKKNKVGLHFYHMPSFDVISFEMTNKMNGLTPSSGTLQAGQQCGFNV